MATKSTGKNKSTSVLSKQDLFSQPKPEVKKEYVEELGKEVYFKQMNAAEQDAYEWAMVKFVDQEDGSVKAERNMSNIKAKYLVRTLCDEHGNRLFSDEDADELGKLRPKVIQALHRIALRINGEEAAVEEDGRKNSNTEIAEDSPSG